MTIPDPLRLSGVIPPIVTPMLAADQVDGDAVGRITDHLINGGVSGIFALGTTGEGPSLSYQMRYEMVEAVCQHTRRRIPVLVCVTDTCLAESVWLAEHAAANGATAIVAAAPFYFDASQGALFNWFTELADRSPLPLLLYNMPGCVGLNLDLPLVIELSSHANIVGIKDSSGDLAYFANLCGRFAEQGDFAVFMGPEELLAEAVALGGSGGVCGGANLLPHIYSGLYRAAVAGQTAEIETFRETIDHVFQQIYRDENGRMNLIPALKLAMEKFGLCNRTIAPPLQRPNETHTRQIIDASIRLRSPENTASGNR
ncbi:MAG: dihydrodipicolinate synthase family protein [Planctomycetaceae bacterium]|nr:dihydrodipicolinate synthase family protein [Planctomycetaceae bacterium]